MSKASYYNDLYSLQDEALNVIQSAKTKFYLTGGTAVSRVYTHHRYSDDLDFFVNHDSDFAKEVKKIEETLTAHYKENFSITYRSSSFFRGLIFKNDITLKVEMVNDV